MEVINDNVQYTLYAYIIILILFWVDKDVNVNLIKTDTSHTIHFYQFYLYFNKNILIIYYM